MNYVEKKVIIEEAFHAGITEEIIYREQIKTIIDRMPMHLLKRLFIFESVTPFTVEADEMLSDLNIPSHIKNNIMQHRLEGINSFTTILKLKNNGKEAQIYSGSNYRD